MYIHKIAKSQELKNRNANKYFSIEEATALVDGLKTFRDSEDGIFKAPRGCWRKIMKAFPILKSGGSQRIRDKFANWKIMMVTNTRKMRHVELNDELLSEIHKLVLGYSKSIIPTV